MLASTMRQAVYLGRERVEVRDAPVPVPGPRDVLVKNLVSSVCGTDVAVYLHGPGTGHKVDVGGEFGHETVSRVVAVGSEVTDFAVGERVYPYPLHTKGDASRAGTLGGFSEYMLCPNAVRGRGLYAVDPRIPDKTACLIEPFTVGGRAAKQGNPQPGEAGVVFGCGTIGIAAAIMLKHLGMERVMVCDHSELRLSIARGLGFEACNPPEEDFLPRAAAYFGQGHALAGPRPAIDIWIDAAGAPSVLDDFMAHGIISSRFVTVAVAQRARTIDMLDLTYASKSVIGSGGYRPEDVGDVQDIMTSGRWDIGSISTHRFPLSRIEDALRAASQGQSAFNVLVTFEE